MGSIQIQIALEVDELTKGLKVATSAVGAAAGQMKVSLGGVAPPAKESAKQLDGLGSSIRAFARTQRAEAGAGRFFVSEIAQIIPISNEARGALSGALGAIIGGGIGGAAVAIIQALAMAWQKVAEDAKRAEEAARKVFAEYRRAAGDLAVLEAEVAGGPVAAARMKHHERVKELRQEEVKLAQQIADKEREIEELRIREGTHEGMTQAEMTKTVELGTLLTEQKRIGLELSKANFELTKAEAQETEKITKSIEERVRQEKAAAREAATKVRQSQEEMLRRAHGPDTSGAPSAGGFMGLESSTFDPASYARMLQELAKASEESAQRVQQAWVATGEVIGSTFGTMFAQIITGEGNVAASVVGSVRTVVRALMVEAMARAAKAYAWNPVTAAVAAATMAALFEGFLSKLPSARGGWKVPTDTLAMVHAGEHVIPQPIARAYERGAPGGGGGPLIGQVNAMDAASFRRFLRARRGEMTRMRRELLDDRRWPR